MRTKLRETKEKISLRDTIRTLKSQIEFILWYLRNTNTSAASGTSGSGTSFSVPTVDTLPAIPTEPETFSQVFWTSAGDGTGDSQLWEVYTGQAAWTPCQKQTTKSGEVV